MKIINLKLNLSKLLLVLTIVVIAILITICITSQNKTDIIELTNENYTKILKDCHENISKYINKKIKMTGYVFKADNFLEEQFVTARDMLINETEAQIVGFLCSSEKIKNFESNEWIEVTGTIEKGYYYGEMPIVNVTEIKKINTPNEIFVYPPK